MTIIRIAACVIPGNCFLKTRENNQGVRIFERYAHFVGVVFLLHLGYILNKGFNPLFVYHQPVQFRNLNYNVRTIRQFDI